MVSRDNFLEFLSQISAIDVSVTFIQRIVPQKQRLYFYQEKKENYTQSIIASARS